MNAVASTPASTQQRRLPCSLALTPGPPRPSWLARLYPPGLYIRADRQDHHGLPSLPGLSCRQPPGAQERASAASVFWSSDIHPPQTAGIGAVQGAACRNERRSAGRGASAATRCWQGTRAGDRPSGWLVRGHSRSDRFAAAARRAARRIAVCTDALTKLEFAALICARAFLPTVISDPCRVGHR